MRFLRSSARRVLAPGSFGRGVAMLSGGTIVGQGIVVAVSPLLTRLYTPEMFGAYALYGAILSVTIVVAALRYPLAIPLPDDDHDGLALVLVSFASLLAVTSVFIALGAAFGHALLAMLDITVLAPYLWLLPIGLLGAGAYQILSFWAIRRHAYRRLAVTKFTQGVSHAVTQVAIGVAGGGVVGLIAGDVVGKITGSGSLLRATLRDISWPHQNMKRCWANAVRYVRFPLVSSGSALLNIAALHLPTVLLLSVYGPGVAGLFALAQRVIATPMSLVGTAISQVYVGQLAEARREAPERLLPLLRSTSLRLFTVGIVPAIALVMAGPWAFAMVFGDAWEPAGVFARALAPSFLMQFATVPVSQTLNVLERQDLQFWWDAGRLIIVLTTLVVAERYGWSPDEAVVALGLVMAISYAALLGLSFSAVRQLGR